MQVLDDILLVENAGEVRLGDGALGVNFSGIRMYKSGNGELYRLETYFEDKLQLFIDERGRLRSADGSILIGANGAENEISAKILPLPGSDINGSLLTVGSVVASKLSDSSKFASTTCIFSASDYRTVNWTSGTLRLADGRVFSINSGSTGAMSGLTFVYFDSFVSPSSFQLTTDLQTVTKDTVILVCDAKPAVTTDLKAFFVAINDDMMLNVNQLSVNYLSALSADLGEISAGLARLGAATSFTDGAGIWLDGRTSNAAFRVGNPANNKFISYDAATDVFVFGTDIAVTWGSITGSGKPQDNATLGADFFTNVSNRPLYLESTYIDFAQVASGRLIARRGAGTNEAGITSEGTTDSDVRIYSGAAYASRASAPFRVTQAGSLYASNATISGAISGSTITSSTLTTASSGKRIDIGTTRINIFDTVDTTGGYIESTSAGLTIGGYGTGLQPAVLEIVPTPSSNNTGIRTNVFYSAVATGTPPLGIQSTTRVDNLNVQYLSGNDASAFAAASHAHSTSDITSGFPLPVNKGGTGGTTLAEVRGSNGLNLDNTYALLSHDHFASAITNGTFDNARISQGNVTQHQAALSVAASQLTGTVLVSQGGTGLTTMGAGGALIYSTSATALSTLGIAAPGNVLTSSGTAPQWTAGYPASAWGSLTAYSPAQYLVDNGVTPQQEVKKRTITINGVTVTVLVVD